MFEVNIGRRIREQRNKKHLTIEKFAEVVNLSAVYVGEIERNEKMPSLLTFINIINALGLSPDICLCDMVDTGKTHVFNEITEMMKDLSPEQVCYIRDMIKVTIKYFKNH
ncbi:MAG: hypothetical protein BGN88_09760 [Clostridiales bacterium 43-6]|nr:MAG: hypothetical protein BGN88_09760 [Clostridiales bacterium 43-6]